MQRDAKLRLDPTYALPPSGIELVTRSVNCRTTIDEVWTL